MPLHPILADLLSGALTGASSGVKANIARKFAEARAGSMKMLLVFETPDGKIEFMRLAMDREEAMRACQKAWRAMKNEAKAAGE